MQRSHNSQQRTDRALNASDSPPDRRGSASASGATMEHAFHGFILTTIDALRVVNAARMGVIPRITRRLNDAERRSLIKSGAVFVFSVEESGIRRWTEGLQWSPSRIVGNFLVYRQITERVGGRGAAQHQRLSAEEPFSRDRTSSGDKMQFDKGFGQISLAPAADASPIPKRKGLMKKTITVNVDGSDLHLICYYTMDDLNSGVLQRPISRPDIMSLDLPPELFRFTNFRNPPKIERGPDGHSRLCLEYEGPDDQDHSMEGFQSPVSSPTSPTTSSRPYPPDIKPALYPVDVQGSRSGYTGAMGGHGSAVRQGMPASPTHGQYDRQPQPQPMYSNAVDESHSPRPTPHPSYSLPWSPQGYPNDDYSGQASHPLGYRPVGRSATHDGVFIPASPTDQYSQQQTSHSQGYSREVAPQDWSRYNTASYDPAPRLSLSGGSGGGDAVDPSTQYYGDSQQYGGSRYVPDQSSTHNAYGSDSSYGSSTLKHATGPYGMGQHYSQ